MGVRPRGGRLPQGVASALCHLLCPPCIKADGKRRLSLDGEKRPKCVCDQRQSYLIVDGRKWRISSC